MLALVWASCEDDFPADSFVVGEGESLVEATVCFEPFGETQLSSRAAGDAIKKIDMLYVLRYNAEEELLGCEQIKAFDVTSDNNGRPSGEPGGTVSAETNTDRATFKMKMPYGKYHIYVVANIDVAAEWGDSTNYDTVDKLLQQSVIWSESDVSDNDQMMGYVTKDNIAAGHRSEELVIVNSPNAQLKAWVKRVASKVTVAFDTRDLKDNVYIYLKSVAIRDIPKESYMGRDNTPGEKGRDISSELVDGDQLFFGHADVSHDFSNAKAHYNNWRLITNGDSIFGYHSDKNGVPDRNIYDTEMKRLAYEHEETVGALYFYENMQHEGKSKHQDADGDGEVDFPFPDESVEGSGWKDDKPYGTYVEVEGYYICEDTVRPGRGPIRYRFMMGRDTEKDYNAERNRHYKLTLQFKGYANDIDWHIDYAEEAKPGSTAPDTAYVSYLYNQPQSFPVRSTPKPGYKLVKVDAVILQNEWRPDGIPSANQTLYNTVAWRMQMNGEGYYKNPRYDTAPGDPDYPTANNVNSDTRNYPNCEFGFLSLREVSRVAVEINDGYDRLQQTVDGLRDAYFNATSGETRGSKGKRTFEYMPQEQTSQAGKTYYDDLDGDYTVHLDINKHNGERNYVLSVPVYTRANSIGKWSVYSGANPFYEHRRRALVRTTMYFESIDPVKYPVDKYPPYTDRCYTTVMQSYRLDNPRGIYRKHDSREPFHVNLKNTVLDPKNGVEFVPVESHGAWSAEIERDPYGLVRLTKGSQIATGEGNRITGRTGTEIDFIYTPNRTVGPDQAIGAVITVRYHNNQCVHKIIVRQGYGPVQFDNTGVRWSSYNIYDNGNLTKSPLSIGSFFKRYDDLSYPIAESNNSKPNFGYGESPWSSKFTVLGRDDMMWTDIPCLAQNKVESADMAFGEITMSNGHRYRIPTRDEVNSGLVGNKNIQYGFGLVYGDGARETLNTSGAYSFADYNNTGNVSTYGVRGMLAYCLQHGDNIFLPFGASGHGRRKRTGNGLMRYGSLDIKLGGVDGQDREWNNYRPLAYNLPEQYGTVYWYSTGSGTKEAGIDINAGNYMVGHLGVSNLYDGDVGDALPLKPIRVD